MVKQTVRLNADERAICRVRYNELAKSMDAGSARGTNAICKAISGFYKDGDELETGSEYSPLLFPFGNQRAVHRHINEAHVDSADRAIAVRWVNKQGAAKRAQLRELLGLGEQDSGEEEGGTSEAEDEAEEEAPRRRSKRKATKAPAGKAKPAAKRRKVKAEVKSESEED
ncbi:hypothetical protein B0H16DRAFT_1499405 [Mycena metata]|uniref:Uncharacterized protein n=1 Tax=Mycena metata TaxID=1033252 RepID=A0AAD7K750_9AGAR|nr:hypothetical protein B0H16DRAFT_1499405 [Mycena metata]